MRLKVLIVVRWKQMARLVEATHSLRWLGTVRRKLRRKRDSPHVQHPVQVCSLLCTVVGMSEKGRIFTYICSEMCILRIHSCKEGYALSVEQISACCAIRLPLRVGSL